MGWARLGAFSPVRSNRRFPFPKRGQFLIRAHDETLSVATMPVCNPDCSPVGIHG